MTMFATLPSRDFLVRQAVLNAALENFPYGVKRYGAAGVLRKIEDSPNGLIYIAHEARRAYRELVDKFAVDPFLGRVK